MGVNKAGEDAAALEVDPAGGGIGQGERRFVLPRVGDALALDGQGADGAAGHGVDAAVIQDGVHISPPFSPAGDEQGPRALPGTPLFFLLFPARAQPSASVSAPLSTGWASWNWMFQLQAAFMVTPVYALFMAMCLM